jgi:RNA ligase
MGAHRPTEEEEAMKLFDLIDYELLDEMIREGYIRERRSPDGDLILLNYTEKAQFDRVWNEATVNSRGLIFKTKYPHEIVARPFAKFFNLGEERSSCRISMDEPVVVTDKLDGSLGILYRDSAGVLGLATRGSFESEQAIHGTSILHTKYSDFKPLAGWTYLFEIIYPENRIVVDYGRTDDLYLIGAVNIETGAVMGSETAPGWLGPRAEVLPYKTLREAVSAPSRSGKEGFVVRSLMDDFMVKVKQEDYVALHRIVTGLNEKEIWRRAMTIDLKYRYVSSKDLLSELLDGIPDELHDWVSRVAFDLRSRVYTRLEMVNFRFLGLTPDNKARENRKTFALAIQNFEPWLRTSLWLMYDYKDPRPFLWKQVEPKGDVKK